MVGRCCARTRRTLAIPSTVHSASTCWLIPATVPASPDGVDLGAAAPILCAGVTVYKVLKVTDTKPGDWVLISWLSMPPPAMTPRPKFGRPPVAGCTARSSQRLTHTRSRKLWVGCAAAAPYRWWGYRLRLSLYIYYH